MGNFFKKYKKVFFAILFIIASIGIGYLNYLLFFKSSLTIIKQGQEENKGEQGALPSAGQGTGQIGESGIGELPIEGKKKKATSTIQEATIPQEIDKKALGRITKTEKVVKAPTLGIQAKQDGNLQYYNKADGKFYKIDKNGKIQKLSDKVFHNVSNVVWSKGRENKAIIEYPDGSNIIYNFDTEKQITLPKHWKDFDFSPQGDKIISKSMALDPKNRWLVISDSNGQNTKALERLGDKDETVYPKWSPNNQIAAMFTESKGLERQEVYFLGLNKENFKSAVIAGRGFDPKWSKNSDKLLYSVYSADTDLKPNLWITMAEGDKIGQGRKNLHIETWAKKCSFADNENLYCAVPKNLKEGAGMFPELAKESVDVLYKINTTTGKKSLIAIPEGEHNISDIVISDDKSTLYFRDSSDEQIYKIELK